VLNIKEFCHGRGVLNVHPAFSNTEKQKNSNVYRY